jgi:hypothetical protein
VSSGTPVAVEQARSEPSVFWLRLRTLLALASAAALAWGGVAAGVAFVRGTHYEMPVAYAVAAGAGVLALIFSGRKLLAVLVGAVVGVVLASKPWIVPIVGYDGHTYSPNSETAYYYIIPGLLHLAVGTLTALSLKREALRPVFPPWPYLLVFALGAAGAGQFYSQQTYQELLTELAARTEEKRTQLREVAARLDAPAPGEARGLDPVPHFVAGYREQPSNNVEVFAREQLQDASEEPRPDLYLTGRLRVLLEKNALETRLGDTLRSSLPGEVTRQGFERALSRPYLAVYDFPSGRVVVWLVDLRDGRVLLRVERTLPYVDFTKGREAFFDLLTKATGGTFKD